MVMSDISDRSENAFELIRQDHDAFVPNQLLRGVAKTAETNLVNR
jgi:Ca2+-binding EF-hand superfamily protein